MSPILVMLTTSSDPDFDVQTSVSKKIDWINGLDYCVNGLDYCVNGLDYCVRKNKQNFYGFRQTEL